MKRFLVYDAYGTLLKVNANIEGLSEKDSMLSSKIQNTWRAKQLQYTWLLSLMERWVDFNQVTIQALDYAMAYHGVENPTLKSGILSIFDRPEAFEDAQKFLRVANERSLSNAILSNGDPAKLRESTVIAGIDKVVDDILSASSVQIFKPSRKVYQLVLDHHQCEAGDVRFFSSNPWDIAGAKSFGFVTIWINRQQVPFEELNVVPDFEYGSFSEFDIESIL